MPPSRLPLAALVLANAVSLGGNTIALIAIPWFVLTTRGSAADTGLAAFAATAPVILGSLVAGRVVDRLGARLTSVASDILSGAFLAAIPILVALERLDFAGLLALTFLGALVDSAGAAARRSLIPDLAARGAVGLEKANSAFNGTEHVGYVLGAPLAGLLMVAVGPANALLIDAATFAVSAGLVAAFARTPPATATTRAATGAGDAPATRATLRAAAELIRRDRALLALLFIPAVGAILIDPLAPVLLPVWIDAIGAGASGLGLAVGAYGLGGIVGTLFTAAALGKYGRRTIYVVSFLAWPPLYAGLALVPGLGVGLALVFGVGALAGAIGPIEHTAMQERTPAVLLPRVYGLTTAVFRVTGPLSIAAVGFVVELGGLALTFWVLTAGTAALGAWVLLDPGVRAFTVRTWDDAVTRR